MFAVGTTIQIDRTQVSSEVSSKDVSFVVNQVVLATSREIHQSTAATIAAQWQSSGSVGRVLASFASGCEVDRAELLDDIAATRRYWSYDKMEKMDKDALDCLSTFIGNYPE